MQKPTVAQIVALNTSNYPYLVVRSLGRDYHIKNDAAVEKFGNQEVQKLSYVTPCIDTKIQIIMQLEV